MVKKSYSQTESGSLAFWYALAPFEADVLSDTDLPKFVETHREESCSWQGKFLIAGGSNVGHARNSQFSLTQPSVIVEGKSRESMSC